MCILVKYIHQMQGIAFFEQENQRNFCGEIEKMHITTRPEQWT